MMYLTGLKMMERWSTWTSFSSSTELSITDSDWNKIFRL